MTKLRILIFLSTLIVVGLMGSFAVFYARGYRFSFKSLSFTPNGILAIKSEPDSASIYINRDLRGATNASISLPPGVYDVEVKKDGFLTWYKRLTIEKEIVTSVNASLFKTAPSLTPLTYRGAQNPVMSPDGSKIAYIDGEGLWVMEVFGLPLGFSRDPKKVTDGNLNEAEYEFSPDGREILATTSKGIFLLDAGNFTPQSSRVNVASTKEETLLLWEKEQKERNDLLLSPLPAQIRDVFERKSESIAFSPDETMILYEASESATLPEGLVKPLPGSSTQKQERDIKAGRKYVYDIKEDRNFLIAEEDQGVARWFPTSRQILLAQNDKVIAMDYDGTNRQEVYKGAYIAPFAFPFTNTSRLLILTNLGANDESIPNLYTLTIK